MHYTEGELRMAQNGGLETQVAEELELLRQTIVDLQSQLEDKTTKETEQNEQMDLLTTENEDLNALLKEKQREINELEVEKTPEASIKSTFFGDHSIYPPTRNLVVFNIYAQKVAPRTHVLI